MILDYKPVKKKYLEYAIEYSGHTDTLIKRKRILEFIGATPEEWLQLANDFNDDGGKCNHAYCMAEYRKIVGAEIPEPEFFDWQERANIGDD